MLFSEEYYHDLISKLGLPEMPIKNVKYKGKLNLDPIKYRINFCKIAKKFIRYISINNISQLFDANFSMEDIDKLNKGIFPENITVYMKVPLEYGGQLDFRNLFLIKNKPYKTILDTFIDEQILIFNKEHPVYDNNNGFILPSELYIPNPNDLVFIPALKGFAGAGGNTSADKMTEIGSTMFLKNSGRF